MPVFTSQPLSRTQTTSQEFKDYGVQNSAPAPIGNVRLSIMTTICNPALLLHYTLLWAFTGSYLLGKPVKVNAMIKATATDVVKERLFENPPAIVTFPQKKNDTQEAKLAELSFLPQSSNRYNYYKGPANDQSIRTLVTMGADTECYAPYGASNLAGIFALSLINRILTSALGFVCTWVKDAQLVLPDTEVSNTTWNKDFKITSVKDLPEKGIFLPYFDGLLLPDKAETPRIIIGLFSRCLGGNATELKSAVGMISRGWPSLTTTSTGLSLSHLVFVLDLAIKANCGMRPVFIKGEYKGCVLLGGGYALTLDNVVHAPYEREQMAAEFALVSRHEVNLAQISEILSAVPPIGETKNEAVLPEHITGGRALHYYLRDRNLDPTQQVKLRELVQGLRFEETFWETNDKKRVSAAIETILQDNGWLPEAAPFCYKSAALFTKEPILSTCAAFGLKAPSLLGVGNNAAITITKSGKFYTDFKPASIRGVPIFSKPVQQAYEDWKQLKKSRTITLKHGGNDKNGHAKIFQMTMMVPEDTVEYRRITSGLKGLAAEVDKKRKRDGEDDERGGAAKKPTTSNVKKVAEASGSYLAILGLDTGVADEDEEEPVADMDEW